MTGTQAVERPGAAFSARSAEILHAGRRREVDPDGRRRAAGPRRHDLAMDLARREDPGQRPGLPGSDAVARTMGHHGGSMDAFIGALTEDHRSRGQSRRAVAS